MLRFIVKETQEFIICFRKFHLDRHKTMDDPTRSGFGKKWICPNDRGLSLLARSVFIF